MTMKITTGEEYDHATYGTVKVASILSTYSDYEVSSENEIVSTVVKFGPYYDEHGVLEPVKFEDVEEFVDNVESA